MKKYGEICTKCKVMRSLTGTKDTTTPIGEDDFKGHWTYSGNKKCSSCNWKKIKGVLKK